MQASEIMLSIRDLQRTFNDTIVSNLESISQNHSPEAYLTLILIGFLYGALHAVGPGHGKVVVSGYMLANENSLKRGLVVVGLSAAVQALTAILLVVGFYYLLHATKAQAMQLGSWLEVASMALIAALGLWLCIQGLAALRKILFPAKPHTHHHDHAHHHDHGHRHHHHDGECCGHAHAPSPAELEKKGNDHASLAAMIFSIGLRPCTGALLLLYFACALHLVWPGILATLAMALGTALTTGALAVLTVKSKEVALKLVNKSDRGLALAHAGLRIVGGLAIMLIAVMFMASAHATDETGAPPQHPLFRARPAS